MTVPNNPVTVADQLWAIAQMFPEPPNADDITLKEIRAINAAFQDIGRRTAAWGEWFAEALGIEQP